MELLRQLGKKGGNDDPVYDGMQKLIRLSAKADNILHPFTFPFYTITETPDFCVKVYFCLLVPKFLWHHLEIAACAAVIL